MAGERKMIFFDAGETLLSAHPSFQDVFADVLKSHGHSIEPARVSEAFADTVAFYDVMEMTGNDTWSTSPEVSRRFWGQVYQLAFDHLEITDTHGPISDALYKRFTQFDTYRLYPDAVPALQRLSSSGYRVGLISNFEAWLEGMLAEWQVADLFQPLVISGKEGIEKPDPRIFQLALGRAGVSARDSVYVGDHPSLDIEAAKSVGMATVLIDRRGRNPDVDSARIKSLDELPEVLRYL